MFVFVALVGLSALLLTPVYGAADPLDATYIGKPEWPFLFLYQILKYLPGTLEAVGVVLVPLVLLVLLFGVPWFDRGEERDPRRRLLPLGVFVAVLAVIGVLSVLGAGGPTEIVSQPSIRRLHGSSRIRCRIRAQNSSAWDRDSSSATAPEM